MSARDHLHPDQLRMFMTATEIVDSSVLGDAASSGATAEQTLQRKRNEGRHYMDMAGGVRKPVDLYFHAGKQMLVNGHHRVAMELADHPDRLIPVTHHARGADSTLAADEGPDTMAANHWKVQDALKRESFRRQRGLG